MLSQSWVMILMMMMMMREAASADIIVSKTSGEKVRLSPNIHSRTTRIVQLEFRWTHLHLLLHNKTTKCHHGRCELQEDGSLSFSRVQPEDAGNYTLEVYDINGKLQEKKVFILQVQDISRSRTPIISSVVTLCLLLLLIVMVFILRKRRLHRSRNSGPSEGTQVYMVMHGIHSNKDKQQEQEEEEPVYVPCHPGVPAEPVENVYV